MKEKTIKAAALSEALNSCKDGPGVLFLHVMLFSSHDGDDSSDASLVSQDDEESYWKLSLALGCSVILVCCKKSIVSIPLFKTKKYI